MVIDSDVLKRFYERMEEGPSSECWLWTGYQRGKELLIGKVAHGSMRVQGRHEYVHRVSWEIYIGPIPEGLLVLHKCDNSMCVNPAHLYLGTFKNNSEDIPTEKRGRPGDFFIEEVRKIKRSLKEGSLSHKQIAELYGVARETITGINVGRTWSYVKI